MQEAETKGKIKKRYIEIGIKERGDRQREKMRRCRGKRKKHGKSESENVQKRCIQSMWSPEAMTHKKKEKQKENKIHTT